MYLYNFLEVVNYLNIYYQNRQKRRPKKINQKLK